jgi:hypothetical protein
VYHFNQYSTKGATFKAAHLLQCAQLARDVLHSMHIDEASMPHSAKHAHQ